MVKLYLTPSTVIPGKDLMEVSDAVTFHLTFKLVTNVTACPRPTECYCPLYQSGADTLDRYDLVFM